ncbi:MAG: gamma-glutamyltransferase family protein [Pseudomonadota bacterium]
MRDFHLPGRSAVYAANAMVATSHPIAVEVALGELRAGGNAVDAAIAGAVALGLGEPAMTGIGGDMFALVKPAGSEQVLGLNACGRAPAALSAEALRAKGWSEMDPDDANSVVVPGAIKGFDVLMAAHGTRGLAAAFAPTIKLAEEGMPVMPRPAFDWVRNPPRMTGAMARWYLPWGRAPRPGDLFRHQGQAEVLRRIGIEGAKGFYEGEVAEDMIASLNALGGTHTAEDFATVTADWVDPISGPYRGAELIELPPNTHGPTAILMARILEHFDIAAMDPFGAERAHLETEAAKLAYAVRDQAIGDPAAMTETLETLTGAPLAAKLAAMIDPEAALDPPADALGATLSDGAALQHKETIYITVVDRDRMAVSLIYSVYHDFGSCIASEKFGINFNNRAAGFTLKPGHPNEAGGGKRPMHTIIPAMLRQGGQVVMPFGVMGGGYQPHGHCRLISNMLDFGMDPQAAQDMPRLFYDGEFTRLENGYGADVWRSLSHKGHRVAARQVPLGGSQAIWIDHDRGMLIGGTDPRKDGLAHGY